ncbi:NAD(P)/FAD-dependent oxidoreductase [Cribrihabitans neustonicus]|uniref:flavin-dependent monooxygenase QhpG n=1 Tax=Cribrihabitans neustonicus TaxID=1429085 RepID=UPI003B5CC049
MFGGRFFDIAIAGAGPAGSVAAVLLANAGFRVALAGLLPGHTRIEGMAPRVLEVLRGKGLPVEGIFPACRREVRWGALSGSRNLEHVTDRARFDAGLLRAAAEAGVTVLTRAVARVQPEHGRILLAGGGVVRAALLFEARGRRAPRMPGALQGPQTLAVTGMVPASQRTAFAACVEARKEGWLWIADLGDGTRWVQAACDGPPAARDAAARVAALWHTVAGEDLPLPQAPQVRAIAPRLTAPRFDPRCPRLGDAAVALDPLSGHGMFWAVSSALMALPVARALLTGGADLARDFYLDRVRSTFWRQSRVGRDFYRAAGERGGFWQRRCAWPDDTPAHENGTAPRLARRVTVIDGRLERREVLITRQEPGGAGFVFGQEIAPLLRRLGPGPLPGADRFRAACAPDLPEPLARTLHQWLQSRGLGQPGALKKLSHDREYEA